MKSRGFWGQVCVLPCPLNSSRATMWESHLAPESEEPRQHHLAALSEATPCIQSCLPWVWCSDEHLVFESYEMLLVLSLTFSSETWQLLQTYVMQLPEMCHRGSILLSQLCIDLSQTTSLPRSWSGYGLEVLIKSPGLCRCWALFPSALSGHRLKGQRWCPAGCEPPNLYSLD